MVSGGRVDDLLALAISFEQFGADGGMATLHLVIGGFSDIVEKTTAPRQVHVETKLFGYETGNHSNFQGVLEDVLAITGSEVESPHEMDESFVKIRDTDFQTRIPAQSLDVVFHFFFGFCDNFVYPGGMDPSILDQLDQ